MYASVDITLNTITQNSKDVRNLGLGLGFMIIAILLLVCF